MIEMEVNLTKLNGKSRRVTQSRARFNNSSAPAVYDELVSLKNGTNSIEGSLQQQFFSEPDGTIEGGMPALVLSRLEKLPLRNFEAEVRASLDVARFSKKAVILLDEDSSNIEEIIENMLRSTFDIERGCSQQIENDELEENNTINAIDYKNDDKNSPISITNHPGKRDDPTLNEDSSCVLTKVNPLATVEEADLSTEVIQVDVVSTKSSKVLVDPVDAMIEEATNAIFLQFDSPSYTYRKLAKTITSTSINDTEGLQTDQSWICAICSLASITRRHVAIARLSQPINLDQSSQSLHFVILVITPTKEKGTKSDIELSRTFSTMFSDIEFRQSLMDVNTRAEFVLCLQTKAQELTEQHRLERKGSLTHAEIFENTFSYQRKWPICNGIWNDLKNRVPIYHTDFIDGFRGKNTIRKVISATTFLYFVCLLPSIAFGALNENNTNGQLDVQSVIVSQTFGGLCFALFAGQPLVILLTTAPLAIYTKVIYLICEQYDLDFKAMYGWVGVFNAIYLTIYSMFDLSRFMKWSTRSTEETFAFFISVAFFVDASKDIAKVFDKHYYNSCNDTFENLTLDNSTFISMDNSSLISMDSCQKETSLLFLLLIIGTVWLSVSLFNITKTPYLNTSKRELISDFALPVAVLVMSFIGSFCFRQIQMDSFSFKPPSALNLQIVPFLNASWQTILGAIGLGFPLSLLFFMDQNISGAMVNSPSNKLKKPGAYNWDIFVVAMINLVISLFGFPWVHGALPHSPLHVKALADIEERVDMGHHVHQVIVRVRETRVTGILAHILIGLSLLLIPIPIKYIPVPVLDGIFIYMAITALYDNQFFERMLLLIMEQTAYPPSHYLCRVPQRQVHIFTLLQTVQLGCLCVLGFAPSPYAKMGFPLLLIIQLPVRHLLLPKIIKKKYLEALDKPM